MTSGSNPRYYARICWNTNRWEFPSGDACRLEDKTYAATKGFGHEEWLFNFLAVINGYQYAFIQGVNFAWRDQNAAKIDLLLWSIDSPGHRVYVAEIRNCEILNSTQSAFAYREHERTGFIRLMRESVRAVKGMSSAITADGLFNIRFKPNDSTVYDLPIPALAEDHVSVLDRYKLVPVHEAEGVHPTTRAISRSGSTELPVALNYFRETSLAKEINPYHPVLQRALMILLRKEVGKKQVVREADGVDLALQSGEARALIEIKTDAVAKRAVREALGQILEYAYWGREIEHGKESLFIIAPGQADATTTSYISLLKDRIGIPIEYCQFLPGDQLPEKLLNWIEAHR